MKVKSKLWIIGYLALVIGALSIVGLRVVKVDPFFHYHKPDTDTYYYNLNNQRSQNNGIVRHFEYDALITGTSMTENFKTSELDAIFGTNSIKVPYSGSTFKEVNDNLIVALSNNPDLKIIVRGLDTEKLMEDKDALRHDQGAYPFYLYDNNIFNDVKYIFNRDVVFKRVIPMVLANDKEGFTPGITSFDQYSNWMERYTFGIKSACPDGIAEKAVGEPVHLTDAEREMVRETARQNITSLAEQYPDVTFYYFFTPYSIMWWQSLVNRGNVYKQIEAEELVIEEILKYSNIKLYSFNLLTDIITDMNHYKDFIHYGSWINSLMLQYMYEGKCLLTYENYEQYLEDELAFYTSFDYAQLNGQTDYENDYYAQALLNEEINGVEPMKFSEEVLRQGELQGASIVLDQHGGSAGIECKGRLQRKAGSEISISEYIISTEYAGCKITVDDISDYKCLSFYGMKGRNHGQPSVYIYNENNEAVAEFSVGYPELDGEWHQYMMDVSQLSGRVDIVFNGGYIDSTGSPDSLYTFSDITLY